MSESQEGGTLHIGLLTSDRRHLVSPSEDEPSLFTSPLHQYRGIAIENQAKAALYREYNIPATSAIHRLHSEVDDVHNRGFLLGGLSTTSFDEQGFRLFSMHELERYYKNARTVQSCMGEQILRFMH